MRQRTLRKLSAIAGTLIVGIGSGVGGALALGATTQSGEDRPVAVGAYEVLQNDSGGTEITVWVTTGSHTAFTLWLVEDRSDRVEVSVHERANSGARTMDLTFYRFTWPLSGPLGSRPVVDTATGKDVPPHR
jgi:hypothetical protein